MKRVRGIVAAVALVVAGVASYVTSPIQAQANGAGSTGSGTVERLYVLDGGVGRSGNMNSWSNMINPPGTQVDIGAYAHLIKHKNGWMMFDTSSNDIIATMKEGYGAGAGGIRWIKTEAQTLTPQLKAIGIGHGDIKYIGISHSHADHTGNVHSFPNATVLIQAREYMQMTGTGGTTAGPPIFAGQVFPRDMQVKLLDGDYDVFGDGSVVLFYVGGHTLGHQVAMVRLPKTGAVILSGDAVHFQSNWDTWRIPRVQAGNEENHWLERVPVAYARIQRIMDFYKGQLWIHHDVENYKGRKLAPAFHE